MFNDNTLSSPSVMINLNYNRRGFFMRKIISITIMIRNKKDYNNTILLRRQEGETGWSIFLLFIYSLNEYYYSKMNNFMI